MSVGSTCHDLVIIDAAGTIVSGHFDKKVRIWDPFTHKCRTELIYDASITSLSYNESIKILLMERIMLKFLFYFRLEKHQVLACCKDDTLKLIDLRQNQTINIFR